MSEQIKAREFWLVDATDNSGFYVRLTPSYAVNVIHVREVLTPDPRDALIAELHGWLKRMSDLKWDDPSYAPNFKKMVAKIEAFERGGK